LKVAEGRVAVLTCRVFGAPRPTIIWQKGEEFEDVEDFHDSRITVLDSGDLEIQVCTPLTGSIFIKFIFSVSLIFCITNF